MDGVGGWTGGWMSTDGWVDGVDGQTMDRD
jgi:hypothetical protein